MLKSVEFEFIFVTILKKKNYIDLGLHEIFFWK